VKLQHGKPLPGEKDLVHPREHEHLSPYRSYFFGRFRVFHQERSLGESFRRRNKAGMLLKWFLLNPGQPGSVDEFIDLFWSEVAPQTALGNFHVTMHYLRRMLEPGLKERQKSAFIHREPNNFYWFESKDAWWTDIDCVQNAFERARKYEALGEEARATFYYRQVASYGNAGFLPEDSAADWLLPYRQHYTHIYSQALLRLIQLYTRREDLEEVLEYAYQFLRLDPCNEVAIKAIVNVYLQRGNIFLAQRLLGAFWDSYERELGFYPGKEFSALRERVFAANN
jgi:DNA-binding SARP family transcriptional activator